MTKAKWLELAERAEKAAGPDREIDSAMMAALGYSWRGMAYWDNATSTKAFAGSPFFTRSLDAITALIERQLPGGCWHADNSRVFADDPPAGARVYYGKEEQAKRAGGATPAIALCAAFCRAMAERASA